MERARKHNRRGVTVVQVLETEKIGLVEWFDVRTHSRRLYVLIDTKDVDVHDIKDGDKLRMKIEAIIRRPRDNAEPET